MMSSCMQKQNGKTQIKDVDFVTKDIEITGTNIFKGILLGSDFRKNEIYIRLTHDADDPQTIGIVDIQKGEIIKTFSRRKGGWHSPIDFFTPTYMQFLDNRYYVVDWFFKIMVFDSELTYLYTTMFRDSKIRYFIDFYHKNGDPFFVIGEKKRGLRKTICRVNIFKMIENRNLEYEKKISETYHKSVFHTWDTPNMLFTQLWSSSWGFEKEGKILFSNGAEERYFIYDLDKMSLESVQLDYLRGKKFKDKDAQKIVYDILKRAPDSRARLAKEMGIKTVRDIAYTGKIYYYGLYDVGENKIGIVGDLDLDIMAFRLDIIEADSKKYKESIWLPAGEGFFFHLTDTTRGLFLTQINVDNGVYVWNDLDEEGERYVKLTRFYIKKKKNN
jgi:hypothetical protein